MNDFLQTLRSNYAEKQRPPMTRRSYDEAFNSNTPGYHYVNRAVPPFRRHHPRPAGVPEAPLLHEVVEDLNTHIRMLCDNQQRFIATQEKTADMLERQVLGIERILDHLNIPI